MKITGTRSTLHIEHEGKTLTITGELTTTPAFYANINSIRHWETAKGNVIISDSERDALVQQIIEESRNGAVPIYFD